MAHLRNRAVAVGAKPGGVAAALAAVNPYAVSHDTRLQDTVMFNALLGLSVLLLIRAARTSSRSRWLASVSALALATLTTARLALFVPLAIAGAADGLVFARPRALAVPRS